MVLSAKISKPMRQSQAIHRKFQPSIARRLEQVDERLLAAALDEIEADKEVLDAILHSRQEPTPPRSLSELRAELKHAGKL